ncbi:RNA polymerase sigma factor [Sphingosinicella rhizophila]|uniref:RNA polymerase sigma factor n=1 Tax=Sphingosinicella rhizophila TaxID=3050082 RepID=A0ABU3QAZ4_9SPHN|nr:RNA polymerase sigma factor [Sphingosinicella sp. GR2756]MDT9600115.1 RNA polymerase sigma factor [Sphingosinicella sp. GR2756]
MQRGQEGRSTVARNSPERVAWVGSHIVPHEADLRVWLRRTGMPVHEVDDVVQDAYVRIAQLAGVEHIRNPRSYFFITARSAMVSRIRRERIVRIDSMNDIEALAVEDMAPGPERQLSGRQELERVGRMIEALPERCREIFRLRRIEGVPQREIAARLGISEHVVEQQAVRGLKLLAAALTEGDGTAERRPAGKKEADQDVRHD